MKIRHTVLLIELLLEYYNDLFERRLEGLTQLQGGEEGAWFRGYYRALTNVVHSEICRGIPTWQV